MHPELRCESYGFGSERQLHLFKEDASPSKSATQEKIANLPHHAVHVKNTFIDGWSVPEEQGVIFRSCPTPLNKYLSSPPVLEELQAGGSSRVSLGSTDSRSTSAGTSDEE